MEFLVEYLQKLSTDFQVISSQKKKRGRSEISENRDICDLFSILFLLYICKIETESTDRQFNVKHQPINLDASVGINELANEWMKERTCEWINEWVD